MTGAQIKAIATLINMAANLGVDVYEILNQSDIDEKQWRNIRDRIDLANKRWEKGDVGNNKSELSKNNRTGNL